MTPTCAGTAEGFLQKEMQPVMIAARWCRCDGQHAKPAVCLFGGCRKSRQQKQQLTHSFDGHHII
jgi:hypothetical protein